ncbi:MAG: prepilin-type N-terminal cleavage/methylation domain-containing protein [Gemmataceae bacterium]
MMLDVAMTEVRTRRRSAFTLLEVLVVVAILVILAGVASVGIFRFLEDAKEDTTKMKMQQLSTQCRAYAAKNGGDFPQSLNDLISPPDGQQPFLEGGMDAITSAWGTPIQYSIETDQGGSPVPVFRSQSADGKRRAVFPKWAQ